MKLAGLYDKDADYDGMIPEAVLALVKAHSEQGHSGGSHGITLAIFNKVINYQTLSPLTSNPDEWMHVGKDHRGECYQSMRHPACFSYDQGKTWYDLDDPAKTNFPEDMK
jgi:hypothetical protein